MTADEPASDPPPPGFAPVCAIGASAGGVGTPGQVEGAEDSAPPPDEIQHLHSELKVAQEAELAGRVRRESAVQERRASNEELQFLNEELQTANGELKAKLGIISAAYKDLLNLTASSAIGTLFLDLDLRIRMFTPPVAELINVAEADVGRPITNFTHRLEYVDLASDVGRVLRDLRPLERQARTIDGRWFLVGIRPYRTIDGKVEGAVATFDDITERKAAEAALRESEARHRLLIESWAQAVWETDAAGVVVEDSSSWRNYTGQTPEEWLGYGWLDAIHPDDRAYAERQWREAVSARGLVNAEFRLRAPKGGWRWTNVRAAPVLDAAGHVEKWLGLNIDIDDRKQAEAAQRESEERYRALFESMDEAYAVVEVLQDEDGHWNDFLFLQANRAFLTHTGMPYPVGRTATDLLGTPNPRWAEAYGRVAETGEPARWEDSEPAVGRVFDLNAFRLGGAGSRRVAVLFTDITERKRAELALRQSEERFRSVSESGVVAIAFFSIGGAITDANDAFLNLVGYTRGEMEAGEVRWDRLTPPEWMPQTREAVRQYERTGRIEPYEKEYFRKSGERFWALFGGRRIESSGEGVAFVLDITARKQAEKVMRESEDRQAFLLELSDALRASADPVRIQDVAVELLGRRLAVDRAVYAEFVVEGDQEYVVVEREYRTSDAHSFVGRHTVEQSGQDGPDLKAGRVVAVDDTDLEAVPEEQRAVWRALGVRARLGIPLIEGGRPVVGLGVHSAEPRHWSAEDISLIREVGERTWDAVQRARAQAALREREADLARVQRIGRVGGLDIDVSGGIRGWRSPEYRRLHGLPEDRTEETHADWLARVHPDDRDGAERTLFAALESDAASYAGEYRIIRPSDGEIRWIEARADIERDAHGKAQRLVGAHVDVTEQKRVQKALRDSDERLRQFGEASQDVLWIRDAATLQWQYLTPAFETIYGLAREEALAGDNYRSWMDLIVPEDWERAADSIRRVRAGEQVTFEYRVRRPKDGAVRWLRNTDFPITDASGAVVLVGGIGTDITAMKEVLERVERSEERLRSAVEVGRLGLWDWNVVTGEVHWSDEHYRLEGYGVGQVTPSYETWSQRIHPADRPGTEAALRRAMDTGEEYVRDFRVVHPDGSVHWLHGRGRFFYEDDRAIRMVGAMTDITDRREWEERQQVLVAELQHRTRNLMGVVRSMSDGTARASADLPDFRRRFRDRLEALSRVQGLLSRLNEHDRVTFDELIHAELSAMDGGSERVALDGPPGVRLRSSTVQTLAMALHELATNAVKYGALGQPGGKLAISWRLDPSDQNGKPWLHIDWRESGVDMPPPGAAPHGTGQGRELIEEALPYQLSAKTSYILGPDGVHCMISIPVSVSTGEVEVA
jgi:PAS domain S-box-containing protein